MNVFEYSDETLKAFNDYLLEAIKNNYKCAHCWLNHENQCFFAYECFKTDQSYYRED